MPWQGHMPIKWRMRNEERWGLKPDINKEIYISDENSGAQTAHLVQNHIWTFNWSQNQNHIIVTKPHQ